MKKRFSFRGNFKSHSKKWQRCHSQRADKGSFRLLPAGQQPETLPLSDRSEGALTILRSFEISSFTLVEILAVTALVSLLAVIGFAGYGYAMNASRRAATEATLQQISAGLENFKLKNGYYPVSSGYTVIEVTKDSDDFIDSITFGSKKYSKSDADGAFSTFVKPLDQEKLKKSIAGNRFVDSWGGAIYYKYPGLANETGFDLIAPGPDNRFTNSTPPSDVPATVLIKSDEGTDKQKNSYREDGVNGEWNCDDISNFMDK